MGKVIATREAYGRALCEFGADERIMVFDADLTICTMSCYFAEKYPERFFNAGIAECNMAGMAAGAATARSPRWWSKHARWPGKAERRLY